VIHNIWFNEGFIWYIVFDTLKQKSWLNYFQQVVYNGSPLLKALSLQQLSEAASTQYAEDFRLGRCGIPQNYPNSRRPKCITAGVALTLLFTGQKAMANDHPLKQSRAAAAPEWPDSLGSVTAAPENHKVVFENDKVRILEVTGAPYIFEPLHTHKLPSIMWFANANFAKAHLVYYHYDYDPIKKTYYIKDSVLEQGPPANKGFEIPAEGPHRVRNLSNMDILAYRVEFKK
jgi:hypothetical protein